MTALIFIIAAFIAYKLMQSTAQQRKADRAAEERQRIRDEQAAQRREQMEIRQQMQMERIRAQEETKRLIALEREQTRQAQEQIRQAKEQERQAREQDRISKEQERQAEQLERLQHIVEVAQYDIDFYGERIADLYAQLDYQLLLQAGTVPGSKQFEKYQSKIVTLKNQIHTAENKLSKAEWNRDTAQRKLA